jgi:hypothetical protein
MCVSLYIPEPALTDSARRHWNNNFDLLMAPQKTRIFRYRRVSSEEEIVFGCNEPALQHYHRAIRTALAPRSTNKPSERSRKISSLDPTELDKLFCSAPTYRISRHPRHKGIFHFIFASGESVPGQKSLAQRMQVFVPEQ